VIIIGFTSSNGLLVVVSLTVGAVFVARALTACRERVACWSHALMGVAMAGMFWPSGDPVPTAAGTLVFTLIAAWFAASWLRAGTRRVDGPAHVAIGSAAMVLMYLAHGGGAHGGGGAHAAHALHGGGAAGPAGWGALLAAAGLLLTGYFLWHAWESLPGVTGASLPVLPTATREQALHAPARETVSVAATQEPHPGPVTRPAAAGSPHPGPIVRAAAASTPGRGGRHRQPGRVAAALGPDVLARVEPTAHVTMSLLMAVMFLGTI